MAGSTPDALFDLPPFEPAPDSENDHSGAAAGNEHANSTSGRVSYPTPDQSKKSSLPDTKEDSVRFDLGYDRPPPAAKAAEKPVGRRRQTRPRPPGFVHSSDWVISDAQREVGKVGIQLAREALESTRSKKADAKTRPAPPAASADSLHQALTDEPF